MNLCMLAGLLPTTHEHYVDYFLDDHEVQLLFSSPKRIVHYILYSVYSILHRLFRNKARSCTVPPSRSVSIPTRVILE